MGNSDAAQGALGDVVVYRQPAVSGIARQRLPAAERRAGQRVLR